MRKHSRAGRVLTASAFCVAGGVLLLPSPALAQSAGHGAPVRIGESQVQIVNAQTGKCATVAGGTTTENNHPLVQFSCDSHPSRHWSLTNQEGDSFQIVNDQTGKCMTVAGGTTTANNHPLVQFDCDSHPSRRWTVTNQSDNAFQLVNDQTGKCATVAGGTTTANNHPLVQFDCDSHPSRRWELRIVG